MTQPQRLSQSTRVLFHAAATILGWHAVAAAGYLWWASLLSREQFESCRESAICVSPHEGAMLGLFLVVPGLLVSVMVATVIAGVRAPQSPGGGMTLGTSASAVSVATTVLGGAALALVVALLFLIRR